MSDELKNITLAIETSNSTASLLRAIRKIRKVSILEVSNKTGINRNTIGRIESGDSINSARLETLCSIARALKCDLRIELRPYELFTDKDGER